MPRFCSSLVHLFRVLTKHTSGSMSHGTPYLFIFTKPSKGEVRGMKGVRVSCRSSTNFQFCETNDIVHKSHKNSPPRLLPQLQLPEHRALPPLILTPTSPRPPGPKLRPRRLLRQNNNCGTYLLKQTGISPLDCAAKISQWIPHLLLQLPAICQCLDTEYLRRTLVNQTSQQPPAHHSQSTQQ